MGFENQTATVQSHFEKTATTLNDPLKSAGWRSKESVNLRYWVASSISDLSEVSVLDVGCGPGLLSGFFKDNAIGADYHGCDLSPAMIEKAKLNFPDHDFFVQDIADSRFKTKYDYVFSIGAFNLKVDDQWDYLIYHLERLYSLAHQGVAVSLLSSHAPESYRHEIFYYYQPEEILKIALKLTPFVELKLSYLPHDMTLFLFKS